MSAGPFETEIAELSDKLARHPGSRIFAPLADAYRRVGRIGEAVETCRLGLSRHSNFLSARLVLARCHYEQGELDSAEDEFEEVLRSDPENVLALRSLGEIARSRGAAKEAVAWYERALAAAPGDAEIEERLEALRARVWPSPAELGLVDARAQAATALPLAREKRAVATVEPAVEAAVIYEPPAEALVPGEAELVDEMRREGPAAPAASAEASLAAVPEAAPVDLAEAAPEAGPEAAPVELAEAAPEQVPEAAPGWASEPSVKEATAPADLPEPAPAGVADQLWTREAAETEEIATLTLARVYAEQGLRDRALDVYRRILQKHPENTRARDEADRLERELDEDRRGVEIEAGAELAGFVPGQLGVLDEEEEEGGAGTAPGWAGGAQAEAADPSSWAFLLADEADRDPEEVFGPKAPEPARASTGEPRVPTSVGEQVAERAPDGESPAEQDDLRKFREWLKTLK